MGNDLIDRQEAIDALVKRWGWITNFDHIGKDIAEECKTIINGLPSAQPEIKPIEYRDCANAMLRMWMDNVVTDGEYNRIMDKLNAYWGMENG